jgi:DNA-binding NarL/FixJ family response regulator
MTSVLHVSFGDARTALRARRSGQPRERRGGLSAREEDVVRLLATGMTNREIAATLALSDRTVAHHVERVFTKLKVSSRAAATAYAVRNGLA